MDIAAALQLELTTITAERDYLREQLDNEKKRIKRPLTTDGKGVKIKAELLAGLLEEMGIKAQKPKE